MASVADTDEDTRREGVLAQTTSAAAASPPAHPPRSAQVPDFDYSSRPLLQPELLKGLGVAEKNKKEVLNALTDLVKKLHPHIDKTTGDFTERSLKGDARVKLCNQLYDATPSFCDAPRPYRDYALGKLLTQIVSFRIRKRVPKPSASSSYRASHNEEPRRRRGDLSDDESDSTDTKRQRRSHPRPTSSKWENGPNSNGTDARRSRDIISPMMTWPDTFRGPDISTSMVLFYSVKDGKLGTILSRLQATHLRRTSDTISWEALVQEASVVEDEGFQFKKLFYLSPRTFQDVPIRTQGTLNTALSEMKPGDLIFTTFPVDPDVKMEDASTKTDPDGSLQQQDLPPAVAEDASTKAVPDGPPQQLMSSDVLMKEIDQDADEQLPISFVPSPRQSLQRPATTVPDSQMQSLMDRLEHYPDPLQSQPVTPQPVTPQPVSPQPVTPQPAQLSARKQTDGHPDNSDSDAGPVPRSRRGKTKSARKKDEEDSDSDTSVDDASQWTAPTREYGPDAHGTDPDDDDLATLPDNDAGEEDPFRNEVDDETTNDLAASEATRYALTQPASKTAYAKALKEGLDEWVRAAKTYHVGLSEMKQPGESQSKQPDKSHSNRIPLKAVVGISTKYRFYAHQIPGAVEMFCNVFGPRRSMIQGDEMGYGKTSMVMMVWDMNFRGVAQIHGAKAKDARKRDPLQWPVLEYRKLHGCAPRVGALFISASPNAIEVWVKTYAEMCCGDASHTNLEDAWKPKLVILHAEGAELAKRYGGEKNGIHSSMTAEDWAEILPKPNWDNARIAHGEEQYPEDWRQGWCEDSSWVPHPAATDTKPSPTSTRYIIISTNLSWRTKVGCLAVDEDIGKPLRDLSNELLRVPIANIVQQRNKRTEISKLRLKKLQRSAGSSWQTDGAQPMQATRRRFYQTTSSTNTTKSAKANKARLARVLEVVDLRYASWVVIDELHSAAGADTLTYRQIIDPFIAGCGPGDAPGILGITGTALQSGAGLMITFAQKVCLPVADENSDDPGVRALLSVKGIDIDTAWKAVLEAYIGEPDAVLRQQRLETIPNVDSFHMAFRTMLEFYLIARDSNSKDPWGRLLTILDVKLDISYLEMAHKPAMWEKVKEAETSVQTFQRQLYDERLAIWQAGGCVADQKPAVPSLANSSPNAYMVARLVSCFPNLLDAIKNWRLKNPEEGEKAFPDLDNICLGDSNPTVRDALKSTESIRNSFIWTIAPEACEGSKKVKYVVREIKRLERETTKATVMTNAGPEQIDFISKFVVAVTTRLGRALLTCRLRQIFGSERVVEVADKKSRLSELPKWQRYWDADKQEVSDRVNILVAGLKTISQSVTLIEGHVLYGFDPPSNNSDEKQYAKRQYRIGQEHDCRVVWLVTVNSTDKSKRTIESNIVMRNQSKTDFFMDMRNAQATASEEAVDVADERGEVVDLTQERDQSPVDFISERGGEEQYGYDEV